MLADPSSVTEAKREAAAYIASMITELALIAQNHQLDTLSYILEMGAWKRKTQAWAVASSKLRLEHRHQPAAVALQPSGKLELK
jgi:hypothetical protein